jgi:hypothetical protein
MLYARRSQIRALAAACLFGCRFCASRTHLGEASCMGFWPGSWLGRADYWIAYVINVYGASIGCLRPDPAGVHGLPGAVYGLFACWPPGCAIEFRGLACRDLGVARAFPFLCQDGFPGPFGIRLYPSNLDQMAEFGGVY